MRKMGIEFRILDFLQGMRIPAGDAVMCFITKLGNAGMIWIVLAVILLLIPKTRKTGIVMMAALCIDLVVCNGILKNVFHYLNKHKGEKILVIADGAAFGSEIDRVLQVIHGRKNVALYLPESFEWMIMDADILKNNTVRSILSNPSEYVESKLYFSWERFFTAILIEQTKDTYLAYAKRKLNPAYLSGAIKESILRKMNIIDLNKKDE